MTNAIKRRVFYSFHFGKDAWRAGQVRNIGVVDGNEPVTPNEWEEVKRGGKKAIETWIEGQMKGRTCTIVLIGSETAERPWVQHEIIQSWNKGLGLLGIRIHNLLDSNQSSSAAGANPFEKIKFENGELLSTRVNVYNPEGSDSKAVYATIKNNINAWIEAAVASRK